MVRVPAILVLGLSICTETIGSSTVVVVVGDGPELDVCVSPVVVVGCDGVLVGLLLGGAGVDVFGTSGVFEGSESVVVVGVVCFSVVPGVAVGC